MNQQVLIGVIIGVLGVFMCAAAYFNWAWFNARYRVYNNERLLVMTDSILVDIEAALERCDDKAKANSFKGNRAMLKNARAECVDRIINAESRSWPFVVRHYL